MIYRSNLTCPDLTPHFKHLVSRPMPHSFGHDVPSDWGDKADDDPVFGLYKRCGFWTRDEAAILYNVAARIRGDWVDIGAHTGWTSAHIAAGSASVLAVDPMLATVGFAERFEANTDHCWSNVTAYEGHTSTDFFGRCAWRSFQGVCIDGDHEPGEPLKDAKGALAHLADTGVIIFHDFIGRPVQEAVEYLLSQGLHARVYMTPHMVACCWRGDFKPPDHKPDPNLPNLRARCPEFPWSRTE